MYFRIQIFQPCYGTHILDKTGTKTILWKLPSETNAQKIKFSIKSFFSKCDQIHSFLRIWSHSLTKSWMENFIFVQWTWSLESVNLPKYEIDFQRVWLYVYYRSGMFLRQLFVITILEITTFGNTLTPRVFYWLPAI